MNIEAHVRPISCQWLYLGNALEPVREHMHSLWSPHGQNGMDFTAISGVGGHLQILHNNLF